MKTKIISNRDFATLKRIAQIVNPLISKKADILKKIDALKNEIEGPIGINAQISSMEAGIRVMFDGLGTEDLITKIVVPQTSKDGTPIHGARTGRQVTRTIWKPTSILKYDEEENHYILTIPDNTITDNTVSDTQDEYGPNSYLNTESSIKKVETQDVVEAQIIEDEYNPFNM